MRLTESVRLIFINEYSYFMFHDHVVHLEGVVHGHHMYKSVWHLSTGDQLTSEMEYLFKFNTKCLQVLYRFLPCP